MNIKKLLNTNLVIPAQSVLLGLQPLTTTAYSLLVQAGIQLIKKSLRSRPMQKFCSLRVLFFLLDSRLRGNDGLMEHLV
jgi:hypothetical protein